MCCTVLHQHQGEGTMLGVCVLCPAAPGGQEGNNHALRYPALPSAHAAWPADLGGKEQGAQHRQRREVAVVQALLQQRCEVVQVLAPHLQSTQSGKTLVQCQFCRVQ